MRLLQGISRWKGDIQKKDVLKWCETNDASVSRPIFEWSGQQVIDYILGNGQRPNPLYERGASRVGCFPCIYARHADIKVVAEDEQYRNRLLLLEKKVNALRSDDKKRKQASYFGKNIPPRYCKTYDNSTATCEEVFDYVLRNDGALLPFEEDMSCMSIYHGLCE